MGLVNREQSIKYEKVFKLLPSLIIFFVMTFCIIFSAAEAVNQINDGNSLAALMYIILSLMVPAFTYTAIKMSTVN